VVVGLQRALAKNGFSTLRFDFRGVGESKGSSSWSGACERKDVHAAIDFLVNKEGISNIWLAGYSFGSATSSEPAATHRHVKGYCAISYPHGRLASLLLGRHWREGVEKILGKPKLFIIGSADQFASATSLQAAVKELPQPAKCVIVDGVDHMWMRQEGRAAAPLVEWLTEQIQADGQGPGH